LFGSNELLRRLRLKGTVSERMFVYKHFFNVARGFLGLGNEA
jgi:hypothetical protein